MSREENKELVAKLISLKPSDLQKWPSIELAQHNSLPECMAVYFVVRNFEEVLYIGKATRLVDRFRYHHRMEQFRERDNVQIVWWDWPDATSLGEIENFFRLVFKPTLDFKPMPRRTNGVRWKLDQIMVRAAKGDEELAQVLGKRASTIARWRSLDIMPKLNGTELAQICETLNCSLGDLLDWRPKKNCVGLNSASRG